jgi:hypothetical protein
LRTLTGPVSVPEFFNNLPAPWTSTEGVPPGQKEES